MGLSQEYRPVAFWTDGSTEGNVTIHAILGNADQSMCGRVDVLDAEPMKNRIVTCADCLRALKRERQRRSAEGTIRRQERMARERNEAEHDADEARAERHSLAENLADALYREGYQNRQDGRSYDPRGTVEWQAVVDAIMGDTK